MKIIYADTMINLATKMLGLHHDHCYHLYTGHVDNVPMTLKHLIVDSEEEYCFIYKENTPNK